MKRTALALTLVMTLVFSFLFCGILVQPVKSKFIASVYIAEDGSVVGTNSIQRNGNIYTLTGNISGSIQVQKSYIIIDGAGYTVNGSREGVGIDLSNGRGQEWSRTQINNVTVKNLQIINWSYGICNENTNNNTFIGNYIADCNGTGFSIMGSHNNTFIYNTFEDCASGITITYVSSGNVITENNVINVGFLVLIWGAPKPVVDRNYFSDYSAKYPNAKEIGSSGIWDIPYNYGGVVDNHPLMKPVTNSDSSSPKPSSSPSPTVPEFPSLTIPLLLGIMLATAGLLVYHKKHKANAV